MRHVGSVLWPKLRVLQVYGANTGVGKTIFSSVLIRAFKKRLQNVNYLKPVSTGPLDEADDK
jgi:dethiobiotin synthetase/adenosylmethionine--8-amino-7-oxononanoate aminotransferase